MRGVTAAGLVLVVGCDPAGTPPSSPTTAPQPDAPPLDYAGWPALTPQPVKLDPGLFALCMWPPDAERLSPHFVPQARYLVNPAGEAAVRGGPFPVPVGTTVVKAKSWPEYSELGEWFAAMVKREAGYDPAGGDWEYLHATRDDGRWQTERGKIDRCAGCHQRAAGTNYLFREYLTP